MILVATLFVSTLLNAGYFLPIVYAAFFKPEKPPENHGEHHDEGDDEGDEEHDNHHDHVKHDHGEAPWPSLIAIAVTVTGPVTLFFAHELPLALIHMLAGATP